MDEVVSNATSRDAIFAAIYPPDATILENYARLRSELGHDFVDRYRALVVGVAVADRGGWLIDSTPAPPRPGRAEVQEVPLVKAIADFMAKNSVSALSLYTDSGQQSLLIQTLSSGGFDSQQVKSVRNRDHLFSLLERAMIQLGQRPATRQPNPTTADWLRHLASIYEATPTSTPQYQKGKFMSWPLFPIADAPWPLLMPLARPVPLDEANYIWEKFQGMHGRDRYHTYGPYLETEAVRLRSLQPSPWHWDAWPDRIVHGGICPAMAGIAVDTHSALGEPSVGAGQPGHANLISFYGADGLWYAVVEQAFSGGPDVTTATWRFRDSEKTPARLFGGSAGAEYHLGLAQAMNAGLKTYIDTRIAVNLFHILPDPERKTLGTKLLVNAAQQNPFNPELWYLLAHQAPDASAGLRFARFVIQSHGYIQPQSESDDDQENVSLEKFVEPEVVKPIETQVRDYWHVVGKYVTRFAILDHPVPDGRNQDWEIYNFLRTAPYISLADEMPYCLRLEGSTGVEGRLINMVNAHLRARDPGKGARAFTDALQTYIRLIPRADAIQFLVLLQGYFPRSTGNDAFLNAINSDACQIARKKA
ncbi:MAG TPA: hypothetical protein VMF08_11850 [Candidatus Sulfotelmatobacter sp.]|nr:hypothetical protein [Candidatus Sulfotelmatobacter sp.]